MTDRSFTMEAVANAVSPEARLYRLAAFLSVFTVLYNLAEGMISMWFGLSDESIALFGFGVDSFVEVASGVGIFWMILRISRHHSSHRTKFEITALRITGIGFYILVAGLLLGAAVGIWKNHKPESTLWGTLISSASIVVMGALAAAKIKTGRKLNSAAIVSDGKCTLVCLYMSVVLLLSSGVFALTGFAHSDAIGAAGLAYFSFQEGREALEKARKNSDTCAC